MTLLKLLLLTTFLASCGVKETASIYNGKDGKNGDSCTTESFDRGAIITCGDTHSLVYNGQDGSDGPDGQDGQQGERGGAGQDGENGENGSTTIIYSSQITSFKANKCEEILDTGVFVKFSGTNASLYENSNCSGQKLAQVQDGESYWVNDDLLAIKSKDTFKVINFGE